MDIVRHLKCTSAYKIIVIGDPRSQSVVFNSGQKMALRALYLVICPHSTGTVDIYEVKRSQRHLLVTIESN